MSEDLVVQEATRLNGFVLMGAGLIIGVTGGYLLAKRRLEAKYREQAELEIDEMREHFKTKLRADASTRVLTSDDPAGREMQLDRIVEEEGYASTPPTMSELKAMHQEYSVHPDIRAAAEAEEAEEPEITVNVFQQELDDWDWDEENALRASGADPFIMHRDEWLNENFGYPRTSYTYFEGDDVLADEHDTPADDMDMLVGLANLAKFGHGSGDPNVVYIRNVELEMEIEIVKSEGKFSEQRRGAVEPPSDPSDPRKRRNRGPH